MATYYAVTSTNRTAEFYGVGSTKDEARRDFEKRVAFNSQDIYSVTRHKNLQILSESAAVRLGFLPRGAFLVANEIPEHGYHVER